MGGRGSSSGKTPSLSALGRKGKPATIEQAVKTTNPNYALGDEYQRNCQRCVYTYEMQRRGYNVEALPRILNGEDYVAKNWNSVMENQTWESIKSRDPVNQMLTKMEKWGDGARAVVYVKWKRQHSAHVFIAEHVEGKGTAFVDPQTGAYLNIRRVMDLTAKTKTQISRIDNLKPTALISECMKKRDRAKK